MEALVSCRDRLRAGTRFSLLDQLRAGTRFLDRLRVETRFLDRLRVEIRFLDRLRAGTPYSPRKYYFQARGLGSSGLLLPVLEREFLRERVSRFSPEGSLVSAGK